jgi:hypothetical protein
MDKCSLVINEFEVILTEYRFAICQISKPVIYETNTALDAGSEANAGVSSVEDGVVVL